MCIRIIAHNCRTQYSTERFLIIFPPMLRRCLLEERGYELEEYIIPL